MMLKAPACAVFPVNPPSPPFYGFLLPAVSHEEMQSKRTVSIASMPSVMYIAGSEVRRRNTSLFIAETSLHSLRDDLTTDVCAIADALDARKLDFRFMSASPSVDGKYDDRLKRRNVLDVTVTVVQQPPSE